MKTFIDQLQNTHSFSSTPKRIISLVPSQTELLVALGLENKIVGITKFCVHPYYLKSIKKRVGGTKKINLSKIIALKPDIIICNKEENTVEIVQSLQEICPVWVTNITTIEDNFQMIEDFGNLLDCRVEAKKLTDKLHFAWSDFKIFIKDKPFKKVAYFIWKNPYMVAGHNNYINEILKLNQFNNIYDNSDKYLSRYPEIDIHTIKADGNPDLILLASEPYPFKEEDAFEIGRFCEPTTLFLVDGEMFSWYGSRLIKAFEYFKLIHQKWK